MQRMFSRRVFTRWRGIDMPPLFGSLQLTCRELNLHLQSGLSRAERRHVHSVRCRKVQAVSGNRRMHPMCRRDVFNRGRGLRVIDMPRLFARLQLA